MEKRVICFASDPITYDPNRDDASEDVVCDSFEEFNPEGHTRITIEQLQAQYDAECDRIAEECAAEGYPSRGSNYDLRVENLQKQYPELFD